jgi:putative transposase
MGRFARVVAVGVAHHVTQRGNAKRYILDTDEDRAVSLRLLVENAERHRLALLGYCLMSNHVHLVIIPGEADSLAVALKHTHGRYAGYWNAKHSSTGHVWQGRFYSCPLDRPHLWKTLRYAELNPVRAGMVPEATTWPWSSAKMHCGQPATEASLTMEPWSEHWTPSQWKEFLAAGETGAELKRIRQCTHTGRPLGEDAFVRGLEEATQRSLMPRRGGRPSKEADDLQQAALPF